MESHTVSGGADLEIIRDLFREYSEQVGVDLCFQGFASELAGLPGDYAAPSGSLILALEGDEPAGCVAVRRWDASACEMKRLYVRPAHQGAGVGRYLAEQAIAWAASNGYRRVILDTLPSMQRAQRLYERLGFRDTDSYRPNPVQGVRYMSLEI